jgi:hypothetical protein
MIFNSTQKVKDELMGGKDAYPVRMRKLHKETKIISFLMLPVIMGIIVMCIYMIYTAWINMSFISALIFTLMFCVLCGALIKCSKELITLYWFKKHT